ncbi:hypothetical protein MBLNU230_g1039t1 [Neophaeotheca triangularis]
MHSRASSYADDYSMLYAEYDTPSHANSDSRPTSNVNATYSSNAIPASGEPRSAQVRKQTSLAHISVPSFSAFKSQTSSIPLASPAAARLRSSSAFASPRANSFHLGISSPKAATPRDRPISLGSPLPQQPNGQAGVLSPPLTEELPRGQDKLSNPVTPTLPERESSLDARTADSEATVSRRSSRRSSIPLRPQYARGPTDSHTVRASASSTEPSNDYSHSHRNSVESRQLMSANKQAPSMTLQLDGVQRTLTDESLSSSTGSPTVNEKRSKSPVRGLGAFFGWKSSSHAGGTDSPTTTFSDRSLSPLPSPGLPKSTMDGVVTQARLTPPGLDVHKANNQATHYFDNPEAPLLLGTPQSNAHVEALERELSQVSSELAGSIRREMELEDELDRMKLEAETAPRPASDVGRRSSDYFSDSGASSGRYPVADPDARIEEIERLRRKAEQEKANVKVEMAQRLQTELGRRRELEQLIQDLEEQLQKRSGDGHAEAEERIEELESNLDETRRRLGQEKQAKDNFEDMFTALKQELKQHRDERDNLRDEVVPRLKSKADGLEAQVADMQSLMYENSRMQQELVTLREQLSQQTVGDASQSRFDSIAEESDTIASPTQGPRMGLARSGSLARSSSLKRAGSISRSSSVKEGGSRQRSGSVTHSPTLGPERVNSEGVKDIEDQRDALHKALKLLIARYEKQQKDHQRAMKKLTAANESALLVNPKKGGYQREVSCLKDEVATLRKRTEDALDQKWQYEKSLGGIKMDLDRADQETRELRILLQDQDILAPSAKTLAGELRNSGMSTTSADGHLRLSISVAETERDQARQIAESYRQRALSMQETSSSDSDAPQPEAVTRLFDSANHMDDLAEELEKQVQANHQLRERLAKAVSKGEREQKHSTRQIGEMQKRLAEMEHAVLAAQQHSEHTLSENEAEARRLEEASSLSLERLHVTIPDASRLSPATASPIFHQKSPKLGIVPGGSRTPSSAGSSAGTTSQRIPRSKTPLTESHLLDVSQTQALRKKVRELEVLLREAEEDMQSVVERVNVSQYEVAELQSERDAAFVQMRKLQRLIGEERERVEGGEGGAWRE